MSPQFKSILVATDFSHTSEQAMQYGEALARSFDGTLSLLHVVPDPVLASAWSEAYAYDLNALGERLRVEAEQQLAERAGAISGIPVTTEAVVGSPAATIVAVAAEQHVDLIVMGTHGRSGVTHFFMGSVAERVVRSAPCPVLTVRDAARRAVHTPGADHRTANA